MILRVICVGFGLLVGWKRRNQIFLLLEEKENGECLSEKENVTFMILMLWIKIRTFLSVCSDQIWQDTGNKPRGNTGHSHRVAAATVTNKLKVTQAAKKTKPFIHKKAHCKPPFIGSDHLLICDPQKQLLRKKSPFLSISLTFGSLDPTYLVELGPTYHKISCKSGAISR